MTQEILERTPPRSSSQEVAFEEQEFAAAPRKAATGADLLHILVALAQHRRIIFLTTLAFIVLAVVIALLTPNQYTAETKLMPPQQRDTMGNMLISSLSGMGGLSNMKGLSASSLGFGDPNAPYIGLLQSNAIADRLIDRFHLRQAYGRKLQLELRMALSHATEITSTKDQSISIKVTDKDPERAAAIANAYVQEFQQLTDKLANGEAEQRHSYYERQLATVQNQLAAAEEALKETEQKTGLLDASSQARATYEEAAVLKAEISKEEAAIGAMSSYETSQNSDVMIARDQLATLRGELSKLKVGSHSGANDIMIPTGEIPEAAGEYLRRVREVMHYEQLYKFMAVQYDASRADEGRNAMIIEVVDVAQPPEQKSKPHRAFMVIFATFLGFGISCVAVFIMAGLEGLRRDPVHAAQLDSIRDMLFRFSGWKSLFRRKASERISS